MFSYLKGLFNEASPRRGTSARRTLLNVEGLEDRRMLSAVSMSDFEQLLLELVNRARMDPLAEVSRNPAVNQLNDGLDGDTGTISPDAKQPLAPVQALINAAGLHSQDMLDNDFFSHDNLIGQSPTARAAAQGYPNPIGENIVWNGSTGPIDQTNETIIGHNSLFASPSHRLNMMVPGYDEVGMGIRFGQFTDGNTTFNAAMVTEDFGFRTDNPYITGVVYHDDVVDDDFYSIGESEPGIRITALNIATGNSYFATTGASGGFNVAVPAGTYTVTANGGGLTGPMISTNVTISNANVKVDFDTTTAENSGDDILGINNGNIWVGESQGSNLATSHYGQWATGTVFTDVHVGDFNGDGLEDVVGRAANGTWVTQLNRGDSSFLSDSWGAWSNGVSWTDVAVADFNGDGLDDIVGRANGQFWVAQSTGSGFSTNYWGAWASIPWVDVNIGDFNGDDRSDVVGRAPDGTWWIAMSQGGSFQNHYFGSWSATAGWQDVRIGDFNGDGLDDVAGRTSGGQWWINRSSGANYFLVEYWGTFSAGVTWNNILVGDFNGDGLDDIVGRANGYWWMASSIGTKFTNKYWGSWWNPSITWRDISVADFDGDGRHDIIGRTSGQWWHAKSKPGSFFTNHHLGNWSNSGTWTDVSVGHFA